MRIGLIVTGLAGLGMAGLLLIGSLCSRYLPSRSAQSDSAPASKSRLTQDQWKILHAAEQEKVFELDTRMYRVLVDPVFWAAMDLHTKEKFAATMSVASAERRGDSLDSVEIVDRQSGKTLADWDAFGLKMK